MLSDRELADRLRVAIGRLSRRLRQQPPGALTASQASLLATLHRHGSLSMTQIAHLEAIAPPSATGIVGRLVEKGLVVRKQDPSDQRSIIVSIAAAGLELLDERRLSRTAFLSREIATLSGEDRQTLERAVEVLERINREE